MTILGIVPYAGSEALVKMTEDMLEEFNACPRQDEIKVTAVNNGAARSIRRGLAYWNAHFDVNKGFGNAVNFAIDAEKAHEEITHVLVMNNDLQFPHKDWLKNLLSYKDGKLVVAPCTDRTATKDSRADGPRDMHPFRCPQVSAYCWLVPMKVIQALRKWFRFPLFDPEFFAYGEDDYTSAILRKYSDKKPFLVVPSSWVRHLKAQTGKEFGLSGGMDKNLILLRNKIKINRLQ